MSAAAARRLAAAGVGALAILAGCATAPRPDTRAETAAPPSAPAGDGVIAASERFVIYVPRRDDTLAGLAARFLGSEGRAWEIAEFNGLSEPDPGRALVIALQPPNPRGVRADGVQTVPILAYHRLGARPGKMVITPEQFETQLEHLRRNDYTVIRLSEFAEFLEGRRALPRRSVVITFDDGHVSGYQHAFPLLVKYGYPSTFFLYTDFLGAKEALGWAQIREMAASGLVDFQSHSRTHANLSVRLPDESERQYRSRLDGEVRGSRDVIQRNLQVKPVHFAYPFGDASQATLDALARGGFRLGLTVNPGGNAFYAHPLMLRRTMVFGDHDMTAFQAALQGVREADLR